MNTEKKIYQLFVISILLAIMSFIIPRFTANPNGGFAAATTAALSFIISLAFSLLASIYLLLLTINNFGKISKTAKFVGITPSIILGLILIAVIVFVIKG